MRKMILSALFGFMGITAFGQVTVEHTYDISEGDLYVVKENTHSLDVNVNAYMIVYKNADKIEFYSENHTFENSLDIELDGLISVVHTSTKLFNNDNKIEFVLSFINSTLLYNEDGDQQFNFGEYSNLFNLYISNGSYKILGFPSDQESCRIFTLDGTPPGMSLNENGDALQERNAYPNPAKELINLQYELPKGETAVMAIYNQNGQRIEELKIGSYFRECQLDVSGYASGVYFYSYNGITQKFIVQ